MRVNRNTELLTVAVPRKDLQILLGTRLSAKFGGEAKQAQKPDGRNLCGGVIYIRSVTLLLFATTTTAF